MDQEPSPIGTRPGAGPDDPVGIAQPRLSELSDADLLARHAAGDTDAFGEVVRRHRDRLWAVALRTLGDREEAADAVQDALVKAFRSAGSASAFRGEAAVTTWLHRVVVNACLDRVRSRRSRPTVPLPDSDSSMPPAPDLLGARETALVVQEALAELPAEQRAALVLVDMQGWSVADAAQILDVAQGTVKSRCARGRARLAPLLAAGGDRDGDKSGGAGNLGEGSGVTSLAPRQPATEGGEAAHDR